MTNTNTRRKLSAVTNITDQLAAARAFIPELQERAPEFEKARSLPDDLVKRFADADLIQMAIAADYGGLESNPIDIMEVIEAISYGDASAGWCLMNYQTAALFSGIISETGGQEVFANEERTICGGVLVPVGKGRRVDGGIMASGRWSFGSGCVNANWFFGNTTIEPADGADTEAPPETLFLAFSRDQFSSDDNWHVAGLAGTGSHDVIVEEAFIPEGRWFAGTGAPIVDGPLYKIPASTIFPPCVAMVAIGIARAALESFETNLLNKVPIGSTNRVAEKPRTQIDVSLAEALIESSRSYVFKTTTDMWNAVASGQELTTEMRRCARLAACFAAANAAKAIDILFNAGGSSSIALGLPFQRYWRDVHAAVQHIQVSQNNLESMGRLRLTGTIEGPL